MDKVKYKEQEIMDIINSNYEISYEELTLTLALIGKEIDAEVLSKSLQKLVSKRYIYEIVESGVRYFINSFKYYNIYLKTNEFNNRVIRASKHLLSLYKNLEERIKVITVSIETEAPLNISDFIGCDVLAFHVKEGRNRNYPKYTYKLDCSVKPNSCLRITPNFVFIDNITKGVVDKDKYYYSLRVSIKEFIEHNFILDEQGVITVMTYVNEGYEGNNITSISFTRDDTNEEYLPLFIEGPRMVCENVTEHRIDKFKGEDVLIFIHPDVNNNKGVNMKISHVLTPRHITIR